MSDLTDRLRGKYKVGQDGVYGTRSFADFIPLISIEAADRIDALEAAAKKVVWYDWSDNDSDAASAVDTLRDVYES